jgi:pyruvate kinase
LRWHSKLANDDTGHKTVHLAAGSTVTLHTDPVFSDQGSTETALFVDYPNLASALVPGRKVLLSDGTIMLTVQKCNDDATITTVVENSGDLRFRAGVNLPYRGCIIVTLMLVVSSAGAGVFAR